MRRVAITSLVAVTLIAGCGGQSAPPAMPKVEALTLDVAKSDIKRAGFSEDVEVLGGGTFGILREKNWTVCKQEPAAGKPMSAKPRLTVAHECSGQATTSVTPSPTTTDAETTSTAPSPATEAASTAAAPTSSAPAPVRILNATNNPELAKLLADRRDCPDGTGPFVAKHPGAQIEFDGNILDVQNHGDYKTRFDILVRAGAPGDQSGTGPSFRFTDVNPLDMNLTGPHVPDSISSGQHAHFVAEIGDFMGKQCVLELNPVSTKMF